MRRLMLVSVLLTLNIFSYSQGAQESYTILLLDFEDKSGINNPLLSAFKDTMAFVLSKQVGTIQVRMIPTAERDAFLTRAKGLKPNAVPLEQALLAADSADTDALIAGSYTKQSNLWSLQAQVYHRKGGQKSKQDIQIQGDSVYKLLDEFPKRLLEQFSGTVPASLTTTSWKAYEEFKKGYEEFENYDFGAASNHYNNAIKIDTTLALAHATLGQVYFMMGEAEQATKAIKAAQKLLPKASPMEKLAIRALDYSWDSERNGYRQDEIVNLAPDGIWDEPLIHQLLAESYMSQGKGPEANQHYQQWFKSIQMKIRANPDDASLLHQTASQCVNIGQYLDEALNMELKAIELKPKEAVWDERYILSRIYMLKGDIEQSLKSSLELVRVLSAPKTIVDSGRGITSTLSTQVWEHLGTSLNQKRVSPQRLLRWCNEVSRLPNLQHPTYRAVNQYLMAKIYDFMGDNTKVDATLIAIGSPRESDWMVLGPLDAPSFEEQFPETPPFELCKNLDEPHKGIEGKEVRWESWKDNNPWDGSLRILDVYDERFKKATGGGGFSVASVAYSCIYVEVPKAMDVQVRLGCASIRVWLNDNPSPVIKSDQSQGIVFDTKLSDVSLKPGLNRFLVATVGGSYSFNFYFRITDDKGDPVPGLKFVSAKDAIK